MWKATLFHVINPFLFYFFQYPSSQNFYPEFVKKIHHKLKENGLCGNIDWAWSSIFSQYSAKLLKKPDQCRAVYACSHLFWVDDQDGIKDGERYAGTYSNRFNFYDLIDFMHDASSYFVYEVIMTFIQYSIMVHEVLMPMIYQI